ncbi:lipoprotein [Salmonella enterica]|nr:lipoprotein [Salmonella enterica]
MKRYLFVALIISILSGCQSYAALQAGCVQGNVEACNTLAQRNAMIGNAQAGLNGYNAQRLTEAQINALNAVSTTGLNPANSLQARSMRCYQNPDHSVTCNAL